MEVVILEANENLQQLSVPDKPVPQLRAMLSLALEESAGPELIEARAGWTPAVLGALSSLHKHMYAPRYQRPGEYILFSGAEGLRIGHILVT